ncbi:hypothetical protein [Streptomyces atroolivaceus]|nr:hypothetical protein [Streptomyces atroolivaceus]
MDYLALLATAVPIARIVALWIFECAPAVRGGCSPHSHSAPTRPG